MGAQPAATSASYALGSSSSSSWPASPILTRIIIEGSGVRECRGFVPEIVTPWRADAVVTDRLRVALDTPMRSDSFRVDVIDPGGAQAASTTNSNAFDAYSMSQCSCGVRRMSARSGRR